MIEHNTSRTSFVTLIICLCLCSLITLSVANTFDLSGLEMMSAVDFGDTHLLDQAEFDDDFFVASAANTKDEGMSFSISSLTNLAFQSYSLLPTFPPPKHS
jgi:hypothetical protein